MLLRSMLGPKLAVQAHVLPIHFLQFDHEMAARPWSGNVKHEYPKASHQCTAVMPRALCITCDNHECSYRTLLCLITRRDGTDNVLVSCVNSDSHWAIVAGSPSCLTTLKHVHLWSLCQDHFLGYFEMVFK